MVYIQASYVHFYAFVTSSSWLISSSIILANDCSSFAFFVSTCMSSGESMQKLNTKPTMLSTMKVIVGVGSGILAINGAIAELP